MSSPVVVAHIITRLDVGGAQETCLQICAGLDRERFSPLIVCGPDAGSGGSLRADAEAAGVPVVVEPSLVAPIRPWHDARAVRDLTRRLRRLAPAVVHTHSSKAGVIGRVAARRAGVPVVVHTVHGWSFHEGQPRPVASAYRTVERWCAKRCDALVVVTEVDRRLGLDAGIGRPDLYHLVRSGVSIEPPTDREARRTKIRAELGFDDGALVVGSIGRLAAQKDPLALVEVFASVVSEVPEAVLVLVGDGELRPAVEQGARDRGLGDKVRLLGIRRDVADVLLSFDVFLLTSRYEGLPRTVLEAQVASVPVVAYDVGGVQEVVVDGVTGRLVPPGRVDEAASRVTELLRDPSGAAALAEGAKEHLPAFGVQRMVDDTQALYDELLQGVGRR